MIRKKANLCDQKLGKNIPFNSKIKYCNIITKTIIEYSTQKNAFYTKYVTKKMHSTKKRRFFFARNHQETGPEDRLASTEGRGQSPGGYG